jgi:ABC-type anion transport system duplicated permease subunit
MAAAANKMIAVTRLLRIFIPYAMKKMAAAILEKPW